MGSSLDCFVAIRIPSEITDPAIQASITQIEQMETQLEDLFVVSKVSILRSPKDELNIQGSKWFDTAPIPLPSGPEGPPQNIEIFVYVPEERKCVRCWKYKVPETRVEEPSADTLEEPVCQRCLGVLEGQRDTDPDVFQDRPNIANAAAECRQLVDSDLYRWNWDLAR